MSYLTHSLAMATEGIITAPLNEYTLPIAGSSSSIATDHQLELIRKNTLALIVTVSDADGTVVDLTDYTMKLTVKHQAEDTDANAVIGPVTATIDAPTTGQGTINLTQMHTDIAGKEYTYDVQIEDSTGTNKHTVVGPSDFVITENVTKG